MKILIVFAGLLLVNVSIISYQGDFGKYAYLLRTLDEIAIECAEIAARGADGDEAQRYADELLEYTVKNLGNINVRSYRCEVYFEGESVVALIRMDVENLFRFPFSPVTGIIAEHKLIACGSDVATE